MRRMFNKLQVGRMGIEQNNGEALGVTVSAETLIDLSPVNWFHVRVAVLGALVLFLYGFNTQVIGYVTPQIVKNWHISTSMLGPIFSSSLAGLLVGQLAIAPLSTRYGYKLLIVLCTAVFGGLTIVTTFAGNAQWLIVLRFLTGIGLGGAQPLASAMIGEFCPLKWRSTFVVFGNCGVTLGSMFAGVLAAILLNNYGWQPVLWIGGALPVAFAFILVFALPESLGFLAGINPGSVQIRQLLQKLVPGETFQPGTRVVASPKRRMSAAVTELFRGARLMGTLALWCGFFVSLMVYFFVQNWLTTLLVSGGQSQQAAITITSAIQAGGLCAAFFIGPMMDRLDPYWTLGIFFAFGALFVALIGGAAAWSAAVAMLVAFCVGFCLLGINKGMAAIAVHFYPTSLRSAGLGFGLGIGHAGAVLGPMIAGLLLTTGWKPAWLFYISAAPMLVGCGALLAMSWRYHGRSGVDGKRSRSAKA
jgi:MFS transporter, AAHS family, 4-hydroxybenzoate transporter